MLAVLVGCENADRPVGRADSIPGPENAPLLTVREDFRIAGDDGSPSGARLTFVQAFTIGANGEIIVAERDRVVYFDSSGGFTRVVGRRGAGPGEFQNIRLLQRRGDSLTVYDASGDRVTVLDRNAAVVGTSRLRRLQEPGRFSEGEVPLAGGARLEWVRNGTTQDAEMEIVFTAADGSRTNAVRAGVARTLRIPIGRGTTQTAPAVQRPTVVRNCAGR